MTNGYELAYLIGGLFLSLTIFSLILGDNYLYRLGTSILSGAVSAYICVLLVELYFLPLFRGIADNRESLTTTQIAWIAAVIIGIILLFCKAYSAWQAGGKAVMTILVAASAAVLVLGAVSGTIPAFIRSLAAPFRMRDIPAESKNDIWYWVKNGAVLVSALAALLYTRHYKPGSKDPGGAKSGSVFGNIVIGFSFGALAAAIFMTAANILVNHLSGIITGIQTLIK